MDINFSLVSENIADTYGDAEAIVNVERNRRYTFREYHYLTNRIANMMMEKLNLRRGDCWSVLLQNDNLSLLHYYTALKGEAKAAYCNFVDPIEIHLDQIDTVGAKVVFIENSLLPTHYEKLLERNISIVCMDEPDEEYSDVSYFWALLDGVADDNPDITHDDRADCLVLRFTGGTTGKSKCVMYAIDNLIGGKDLHLSMIDKMPSDNYRLLHLGPISHASGIVFLPTLFTGGCSLTMNERNLGKWCHWVEKEKVTHSLLVPTMLYMLLAEPEIDSYNLSSLKTIYYGASTISPCKLLELQALLGNIFVQIYGSSEHHGVATALAISDHQIDETQDTSRLTTAGKVVPGVELKIVNSDGSPTTRGEIGEIWMKSRAVCMGYLNNEEKTKEAFQDGFWKSGDAGKIDGKGYVTVVDRIKDGIHTASGTVYPTAIEAAINANSNVYSSAVVGAPQDSGYEYVHADVILKPGCNITEDELIQFASENLDPVQVPATIRFVADMPTSPVGKVLRSEVKKRHIQRLEVEGVHE